MAGKEKPYMEVDDLKIEPWTYSQLLKLSPTLEKIASLIEEKGLTLEEITNSAHDTKKLLHLVFQFLPFLSPIVSETLNLDSQEVDNWSFDKVARVVLIIIIQNAILMKQFVVLGNTTLKFLN